MTGKGQATPSLRPHSSPSSARSLLPEQSRLRANCSRDGFATESARRLSRFLVTALHWRGKSRSITAFVVRSERAIVKLIDATEGGTELAYKHFTQQASGVVQTCLYRLRCECRQLGKLPRRHAVDNAGHEHGAQLIGQLIYRPFQDSDRTVGHLALLEQLLAITLAAPHYLSPIPRMVHFTKSSRSGHSAPDRHPMRAATRTG